MSRRATPKQAEFLRYYYGDGPTRFNATASAIAAGYSPSGARVQGHRLTRKFAKMSEEELLAFLDVSIHGALAKLCDIAYGRAKGTSPSVQLQALTMLLKYLLPSQSLRSGLSRLKRPSSANNC